MSSISKRFDAVVSREYVKNDGTKAKQWINIGRAVEWDDGNTEIELTSVPVGTWWNGKIKLFVQKPKEQQAPPRQQAPAPSSDGFEDQSIPF
jgi:hypothetical protein